VGDYDATYAFVSNGGQLEVWEAFKNPHMTIVPNKTAIGHMENDTLMFSFNITADNSAGFPDIAAGLDKTFDFEFDVTFVDIDNDIQP
jgi:hypothetical protein